MDLSSEHDHNLDDKSLVCEEIWALIIHHHAKVLTRSDGDLGLQLTTGECFVLGDEGIKCII